jgi:putative MATE family efflux protein
MRLMKTPEDCLHDAVVYGRIVFSGAIASMIYNMGAGILRAIGDSRRPMIFLIITCFVNIILDIFCVVVLKMGVAGAAVATVLSQILSAVLVVLVLMRLPAEYLLQLPSIRIDPVLLKRILSVGVPAGLQFVTFDLANLLIQSGINSFGSSTIAAFTAYAKADMLTWMLSGAFGVAITTFVGQNYGAQKYDRIYKSVRICLIMGIVLIGSCSAVIIAFRHFILGIFSADPEVIRLGAWLMLWVVPFNATFVPVEIFAGAMRGTGYSAVPTIITSVCVCLFRVLWLFLVVSRFHTMEMLMLCYPISWFLADGAFYITYRRKKWLRKPAV